VVFNPQPKKGLPPKKERKPLKRSWLKKKRPTPEQIETDKQQQEADWWFYKHVWNLNAKKVCANCDKPLGSVCHTYNVHHLLPKSIPRFEHLRHEPKICCLVCGDCHASVTASYGNTNVSRLKRLCINALMLFDFYDEAESMIKHNSFFK
jgi:hypothetical protein